MSYLAKRGSVYYFRRIVPDDLQPVIGRREFMISLRTKDREEAKRLIPARIIDSDAQLDAARKALGAFPTSPVVSPTPSRLKSPAALARERARWEWEQEQDALGQAVLDDHESEIEALEPIMDAIDIGSLPDAPLADVARAGQLLALHERQMADIRVQEAANKRDRVSAEKIQAAQCQPTAPTDADPARSMTKLYERWAASGTGNAKTIRKWRNMLAALVDHLGHDDVTRVTRADLNAWVEALVAKGLTGKTITAGYLPAIRVPFTVAFEDEIIPKNPATAMKVRAPKIAKLRERDLTDDEAAKILRATMGPQPVKLAEDHARARRWVPWLCAYTGARVGEITQLRAKDIQQEDGIWFIHITPEAGSVKNAQARKVPLHSHLIEQGFTKFAKAGDETPLFYRLGVGSAANPASKIRAGHISNWVRSLGITAPQPNHGWRHRFKSQAFVVNMDSEAADIAQGHVPRSEAGKYGQRGLARLRSEIEKLGRYQIDPSRSQPG